MKQHAIAFMQKGKRNLSLMMLTTFCITLSMMPDTVHAASIGIGGGTGGTEFQAFYDFIYSAATGYLGRSIAIVGGLIGLGIGAGTGKALPAIIGVFLAIFGVLGPTIVNAMFTSAVI